MSRLGEALAKSGRTLDSIIMTGDIADKNNEGGYQAFISLLNAHGDQPSLPQSAPSFLQAITT